MQKIADNNLMMRATRPVSWLVRLFARVGLFALGGLTVFADQAATVTAGSTVTLSVSASGTSPFSYQWKKSGADISGAVNSTYQLTNIQAADAGSYSVVVTNSAGSATSDIATLTINTATPTAPTISTQPQSRTVSVGASTTFSIVATGYPSPSFQWKKAGIDIAGATSANYTIASVQVGDTGSYSVVVSNSMGSVTSVAAALNVTGSSTSVPSISVQPQDQIAAAGTNVTFTVAATGSPAPSYQWKKDGANISGATSASYTITGVQSSANGSHYSVTVTNSAGSITSRSALLTISSTPVAPTITMQPTNSTVLAGADITLSVGATGAPAPSYQWRKNGVDIIGATSSTYAIAAAQSIAAGSYAVVVSNSAGSVTSSTATLTVSTIPIAPTVTSAPQPLTLPQGASATFSVSVNGTGPLGYQWRKNGTPIANALASSYTIPSAQAGDAATYSVVVSNSAGSVTSAGAALTVQLPLPPTITQQPSSVSANLGQAVTFSVIAAGTPSPTYQWRKNGANISGATGTSYSLASVVLADNGSQFTVVVSNSAGSVTSNVATLTVNTAPTFTLQPLGQYITTGANVTFTAAANAAPAPTFQWKKNGVNIPGATSSSLTISAAQLGDSAAYTVVASNSVGSTTSNTATLTVTAPPATPVQADFNMDGKVDILWRNVVSGDIAVWYMNGTTLQSSQITDTLALNWEIDGKGDFNADGQTDLLVRDLNTGEVVVWLMNGTVRQSIVHIDTVVMSWQICGTGDFNSDGKTDILWRNTVSGDVALWVMNGTNFQEGFIFNSVVLSWDICGTGDFNGDGKTDILWRNNVTGDVALWVMDGTNFQQGFIFSSVALSWDICGTGDFNGDNKTDILWRNNVSGDVALWIMDGTTFQQGFVFSTIALSWQICP